MTTPQSIIWTDINTVIDEAATARVKVTDHRQSMNSLSAEQRGEARNVQLLDSQFITHATALHIHRVQLL